MIIQEVLKQYQRWGLINGTRNLIYHYITRERKKRYGNCNPDKTFYIIRCIDSKSKFYLGVEHHLLANYFYVLSHIYYCKYCCGENLIPVVDQQYYPVYNLEDKVIHGTQNAWEYFWEQPSRYSLEEVYQSKHVLLSKRSWYNEGNMEYDISKYYDQEMIQLFFRLSEMVPLNITTKKYIDLAYETIFPVAKRVLGVSIRSGGYAKHDDYHGPGHPIQPEITDLIRIAKERIKLWKTEFIFITTEEKCVVDAFLSAFGDKLIFLERPRYEKWSYHETAFNDVLYLEGRKYQTALNYLTEMELLSRCDCLIGSLTSGLRYAVIRNCGKYENMEIIDCGRFPDTRRKDQK